MRIHAYNVFEIVAWPAVAWCGIEIVLRTISGTPEGLPATAFTGACAALTVVACRLRSRQLAPLPIRD